ncbi:extracellular solute-binding protein [Paenibacillus rigui]|uniref:ABC transporter substrate-binding protein n=1 Tax=Paenibacillus rigui TaxID=554312 RepID=A0A229UIA1_9BACL|nr:extracellular solute-binding protein [Paenibacillus rigui]OXM82639.1 ABC transporter substrate-binding protein [Paenibacillus rigui]
MKLKRNTAMLCTAALTVGLVSACANKGTEVAQTKEDPAVPMEVSLALRQTGDIPAAGNDVEQAIEKYTNTKLKIQWIPQAAFNDKINIMLASSDVPKIMKVNYVPAVINAAKSDAFWEIGPYLKDYKNLSAQNQQYYDNIQIDGKVYGIPNYRDIGRAAVLYRKDWFDALGLKVPTSMDEWYTVLKALAAGDPDKNGKADTYGTALFKGYNDGTQPVLTRLAVSIGGVNRWGVQNGKFTPEFMTPQFVEVLKLFRKLYEEKLINQDFAATDVTEVDKMMYANRVGVRLNVSAQNGQGYQTQMPSAVWDAAPFMGPQGPRIAGEPGNFGFLAIPKASVTTEAEVKKLLGFLDKLMDEPMSTLQMRGIEGKHYAKVDGNRTEYKDFAAFQREVKPYRDNLLNIEGYNVADLKDTPIAEKGTKLAREDLKYAVPNPALTLTSAIYSERGSELDTMMSDAATKYIMGKIDDAGWQAEVEKWRKAGGDTLIKEYEAAYAKTGKK